MPPKVNYTKETILNGAVEVIRNDGYESLSARSIAKAMNGSTQPIYRIYSTIEELEDDLYEKVKSIIYRYMVDYEDEISPFLSIGMGYLNFSQIEPELFRYIFLSKKTGIDLDFNSEPFKHVFDKMRSDECLKDLNSEMLKKLYMDMWIYTQGLASFALTNSENWNVELFYDLLRDMGRRLITLEIVKQKKVLDLDNFFEGEKNENCNT